jgi:hypothetical protein
MLTVTQIAELTGYTPRLIQHECQQGRLRASRTTRHEGWQIDHADYVQWRSSFKAWRKPYKRVKR